MTAAYVLAWLLFAAMYALVFRMMGYSGGDAVAGAVSNVIPDALLAVIPLQLAMRAPARAWTTPGLAAFLARHGFLAALFTAAAVAGKLAFAMTIHAAERAGWAYDPTAIAGYAALGMVLAGHRAITGVASTNGGSDSAILVWQAFLSLLVYINVSSAGSVIASQRRLHTEAERAARSETLRAQAEAQALRSQLNPHFLFNTLHSLLALVRSEPARAERALEQFGDLMRYSLRASSNGSDEVRLRDEWVFVDTYLELERLRLGERLRLTVRLDEAVMDDLVPSFCLQPLVENAIRHAVAVRAVPTNVRIEAARRGGALVVEVDDDGPGAERPGETGLGLRLVRERLRAAHGEGARLETRSVPGRGFRAVLVVPLAARNGDDA